MSRFTAMLALLAAIQTSWAEGFDHRLWDALLKQYVAEIDGGHSTAVDYDAFAANRKRLQQYLEALSDVSQAEFDSWPTDAQLAFLINAYNAWTVELILTEWPEVESIKDLGSLFSSPWSKSIAPLLGDQLSLNDIEHQWIRGSGRYQEPRIHFAVNCASVGCPALRSEAYVAERLSEQLDEQTRMFLADRSRNRLGSEYLELSSIFKWYRKDFERGWQGYNGLVEFLSDYADALDLDSVEIDALATGDIEIDHLDYDWGINAITASNR